MIVNLVALPLPPPITGTFSTSKIELKPMQDIGEFTLDHCNVDLLASPFASPSTNRTQLEPVKDTQIKNMMFVEVPGSHSLSVGKDIRNAEITLLESTPGTFRLLAPHQDSQFTFQSPFFFQDGQRTYFVLPMESKNFAIHFHPRVCEFIKVLNRDGIPGLLTLKNQQLDDLGTVFWTQYSPVPFYQSFNSAPKEEVDFEYQGAYSLYNWELFFHTPFLIAMQLSKNQRFEEAQKWFHYIFDPTATDSPGNSDRLGIERFWRVKPFYDQAMQSIQTLQTLIADAEKLKAQVSRWEANPFKPHVIARMRVVAYMKAVVMRYIDNLIAWGDQPIHPS